MQSIISYTEMDGRELTLFNYRMIKCSCITYTDRLLNGFVWISIMPYLPPKLGICKIKNVREEYYLKSQVLLCQESAVVLEY